MMRRWNSFAARSETRTCKLHLTICALEGLSTEDVPNKEDCTFRVQIKWRVPRRGYLSKTAVERLQTTKKCIDGNGCVHWNEDFEQHCKSKMKAYKSSKSWKVDLEIQGLGVEPGTASVLANLRLDFAEVVGPTDDSEKILELPAKCCIGGSTIEARLRTQRLNSIIHPASPTQLLPSLASCVSFESQSRNNINSCSSQSDEEAELGYQSLTTTNLQIGGLLDDRLHNIKDEIWEEDEPLNTHATKKPFLIKLLSWNNRRLGYGVLDHPRDTPLLNKAYSEAGGDDIDNSRRCHVLFLYGEHEMKHDFKSPDILGSDRFEIGKWERRKLRSRDRTLELVTEIFLASIDQRSEKASGEGACTVLAMVIADWLHQNPEILPLRCQFDKLIREGSSEWRNLCREETIREKFSDQHFDLDTVLQAQVRPLTVVPEKSYIGFFELDNMPNKLEFLQGVMSFDSIWEELEQSGTSLEEKIFVVSWNDHFFVLKIEKDAIYIIDTLGERLFEGCKKAYMLKFNKESMVHRVQPKLSNSKVDSEGHGSRDSQELICEGKSCCKEFIKGFLAALPLRELQGNLEKGMTGKAPLHQLLQIEFHFMTPSKKNSLTIEMTA
ncbi:hypothetical protein RJ639_036400 [Escallonia herrerae]|uniref:C2 NT-type domain-containing protein n=1 Tax=Escallonia herrerae TaxID=1293975 RepID=A0AA89BHH5_9ASTE|nr:hypothetical protein RJ639_036400 [Escallonia herrerae]